MKAVFILQLLLTLTFADFQEEEPFFLEEDQSGWIDPNDPISNIRLTAPKHESCDSSYNPADPVLKLILRQIFRQINVDPSQRIGFYRKVTARLTDYEVSIVNDYLESQDTNNVLRDRVRGALQNIFEVIDYGIDAPSKLQMLFLSVEPWIVPLNMICVIFAISYFMFKICSTGSCIRIMLIVIFISSMFTSYNRMYQEKMAKRIEMGMQNQDACHPQGLFQRSLSAVTGLVTIQKKTDCLKFIEAQTVSVMFEIGPLDVFFDVLGNGLFSLMENFATRLNKAAVNLYSDLPLQLQLLMTIVVGFGSLVVFLFGVSRYRISFFGMRFEPAQSEGLLSQIGSSVGQIINTLEPVHQESDRSPQTPHLPAISEHRRFVDPDAAITYPNVTPRTKERIRKILEEKAIADRCDISRSSNEKECLRRSRSSPRIAIADF